jgi:hypothetical protein
MNEKLSPPSLSDISALIALCALGLFVLSRLPQGVRRGFEGALDFNFHRLAILTAISMLAGLVAFSLGVISLFLRSRNKHSAVALVIGGFVAAFPVAMFLLLAHLGYYYVATAIQ